MREKLMNSAIAWAATAQEIIDETVVMDRPVGTADMYRQAAAAAEIAAEYAVAAEAVDRIIAADCGGGDVAGEVASLKAAHGDEHPFTVVARWVKDVYGI